MYLIVLLAHMVEVVCIFDMVVSGCFLWCGWYSKAWYLMTCVYSYMEIMEFIGALMFLSLFPVLLRKYKTTSFIMHSHYYWKIL